MGVVAALRAGIAAREADYGWFVVDRSGAPIEGPFGGESDGYRWIMRSGLRSDDYPRDSLSVSYLPFPRQAAPDGGSVRRPRRGAVAREGIPALIDALDIRLALWIAEASLSEETA